MICKNNAAKCYQLYNAGPLFQIEADREPVHHRRVQRRPTHCLPSQGQIIHRQTRKSGNVIVRNP